MLIVASIAGKLFFTALIGFIIACVCENFWKFSKPNEESPDWIPYLGGGCALVGAVSIVVWLLLFVWL